MTQTRFPIVQPGPKAGANVRTLWKMLAPGSVAVLRADSTVYYEGGIYSRQDRPPTQKERIEYAKIATGRAKDSYPTVARFYLGANHAKAEELTEIGCVDISSSPWQVTFWKDKNEDKSE